MNAVAISPSRPFRAATVADDNQLVFYHGPPFRFNSASRSHSKFVYDVAFSPDGKSLVSVGADAKLFLYDGKTGESKGALNATGGHKGSIFAVGWDSSSTKLVTASADQTIKIWDVEASKVVQYFRSPLVAGTSTDLIEHGLLALVHLFLISKSALCLPPPMLLQLSLYRYQES